MPTRARLALADVDTIRSMKRPSARDGIQRQEQREDVVARWTVALLAVVGAFLAGGIAGSMASEFLGLWDLPCAGFAAALGVVGVAYLAAPTKKFQFAALCLVLGAAFAWRLLGEEQYPEHYDGLAYRPTLLPFASTLVGGVLALIAAAGAELHRRSARAQELAAVALRRPAESAPPGPPGPESNPLPR